MLFVQCLKKCDIDIICLDAYFAFLLFPHLTSPSELWDAVVADALARYQPQRSPSSSSSGDAAVAPGYRTATIVLGAAVGAMGVAAAFAWAVSVARSRAHAIGAESLASGGLSGRGREDNDRDAVTIATHVDGDGENAVLPYTALA